MDKQEFLNFIQDNIISLFTGSEIIGEEESSSRDACVAQGAAGSVLLKFDKNDEYRFVLKRVQPFKMFEVSIIKSIVEEMSKIYSHRISKDYHAQMEQMIIEKAICKSLTQNHVTMQAILTALSRWGMRTYEGNHASFGLILNNHKAKDANPNKHINNFLSKDFSALMSDGINTFMEISSDGYLVGYHTANRSVKEDNFVPYEFLKMSNLCSGAKIGICLLKEGDILLFKDKSLIFSKRGGNWSCFTHQVVIEKMADRSGDCEDVRRAIYLSALDTSFNRCGGCVVQVATNEKFNILKHINVNDVLCEDCYNYIMDQTKIKSFFAELTNDVNYEPFREYIKQPVCVKTANLIEMIKGRKFQELDRKLRLELMGIDGATIIDHDGTILAVGAIIKIEAGSTGGGRLAAAKVLANYGVSIKISNDGSIQGFGLDRNRLRIKPLFIIG